MVVSSMIPNNMASIITEHLHGITHRASSLSHFLFLSIDASSIPCIDKCHLFLASSLDLTNTAEFESHECGDGDVDVEDQTPLSLAEVEAVQMLVSLGLQTGNDETEASQLVKENLDKAVQVDDQSRPQSSSRSVMDLIKSPSALKALTGLPSFHMLDTLCDLLKDSFSQASVKAMPIRDRIVLTLMRLRTGINFTVTAILFGCSRTTVSRYFFDALLKLRWALEPAIFFPSKEAVVQRLPKQFAKYADCRVIVDCTEFKIERPTCLQCRIRTYSFYKSDHTLKIMIGCSPSGLITFISKPYGGRVSDKQIFQESKIVDLLQPNDAVMADKGFLISEFCAEQGITLYRPPFRTGAQQFTEDEANMTQSIASARIQVERAIKPIKDFKFLRDRLPMRMVPHAEHIVVITAAISNLSDPISGPSSF